MNRTQWLNRAAALALLLMVYAAGHHEGAIRAHHTQPACHQNLKP